MALLRSDGKNTNCEVFDVQDIMSHFVTIVLLVGACLVGVAYVRIQRLIEEIPKGGLRRRWSDLRALVLFFIAVYLIYTFLNWMEWLDGKFELIVPALLFLGAVLLLFIGTLALETATEFTRFSRFERESIMDHLTGVYNRRYLDKRIASEATRSRRYNVPLSMMMIDIDHFKAVNDRYGHQIGDQVLKRLGELLIKKVRVIDIVARYGGEEIAILTIQTNIADAFDQAERLRKAVEAFIMVPADEKEQREAVRITVSIGVAGFDQQVFDSQTMIKKADMALYQAKNEGRNRVIAYQDEKSITQDGQG
jgi:diguanylate cyclase (GGDEF)-like protein